MLGTNTLGEIGLGEIKQQQTTPPPEPPSTGAKSGQMLHMARWMNR